MSNKKQQFSSLQRYFSMHWLAILSVIFAFISFLSCAYYIIGPSRGFFHSDCSDSLYWANATVESGMLFDPDFSYAALLPFSSNLWLVPLISLFGCTMKVHLMGMLVFLCLFTCAIIFMCRSFRWGVAATSNTVSVLLLVLSSSNKLREIMWGHVIYYSLALLILFALLGLTSYICQHLSTNHPPIFITTALLACLFLLGAGAATDGTQIIALTALPIIGALVAEQFFDTSRPFLDKRRLYQLVPALVLLISSVAGYALLPHLTRGVVAPYAYFYSTFSEVSDWPANLSMFFGSFATLIGVAVNTETPIFALGSLPHIMRIFFAIALIIVPIVAFLFYNQLSQYGTKLLLWIHIAVSAIIMFGQICGRLSDANWRLLPMLGTSLVLSVAVIRECILCPNKDAIIFRLGIFFCIFFVTLPLISFREIAAMPIYYGDDRRHAVVARELQERGLTYGYATFWNSQTITVLANSNVKVRNVNITEENGITANYYQGTPLWYTNQPGVDKYFVALSSSELEAVQNSAHWQTITSNHLLESFESSDMAVYVFNANIVQTP